MSKRAVILAGGMGKRLRPYTTVLPKPLMPVGEYPIAEIIIRQLVEHGFSHITMAVNHQAELMKAFFNDGSKWGIRIDYSLEDRPLGTMGPLKIIPDLPDDFLVMNGDVLTDLDYSSLFEYHAEHGNTFTISAYQRDHQVDYGVLVVDALNSLVNFMEKPTHQYLVSMGVYILNRRVLEYVPANQSFGFDHLMLNLLEQQVPVDIRPFNSYWLDIGRPDDYIRAIDEFEQLRDTFLRNDR